MRACTSLHRVSTYYMVTQLMTYLCTDTCAVCTLRIILYLSVYGLQTDIRERNYIDLTRARLRDTRRRVNGLAGSRELLSLLQQVIQNVITNTSSTAAKVIYHFVVCSIC